MCRDYIQSQVCIHVQVLFNEIYALHMHTIKSWCTNIGIKCLYARPFFFSQKIIEHTFLHIRLKIALNKVFIFQALHKSPHVKPYLIKHFQLFCMIHVVRPSWIIPLLCIHVATYRNMYPPLRRAMLALSLNWCRMSYAIRMCTKTNLFRVDPKVDPMVQQGNRRFLHSPNNTE